jgi:hypothetical protein
MTGARRHYQVARTTVGRCDTQMLFFIQNDYRVVASDQRGHDGAATSRLHQSRFLGSYMVA